MVRVDYIRTGDPPAPVSALGTAQRLNGPVHHAHRMHRPVFAPRSATAPMLRQLRLYLATTTGGYQDRGPSHVLHSVSRNSL